MTVKTLIEKLSHYNKDAIVRLHHREGEELLFALAFQNDDTTVVLETENDNDMREEIQARFDAALEDAGYQFFYSIDDESMENVCKINEWEFLEDGTLFK